MTHGTHTPPGVGAGAIVAVLAGGAGSRLGGSKPAALLAGRPLIAYPLAAARAAKLEAVVVAKPSSVLPPLDVPVLTEPERPRHPLCGVLRALAFAATRRPSPPVITIGCDMPLVTGPLLAWLAGLPPGPLAVDAGGRRQSLLARYLTTHVPALERALQAQAPLASTLDALSPRVVVDADLARFGDPRTLCTNVNDPDDLAAVQRWLAATRASPAPPGSSRSCGP